MAVSVPIFLNHAIGKARLSRFMRGSIVQCHDLVAVLSTKFASFFVAASLFVHLMILIFHHDIMSLLFIDCELRYLIVLTRRD